MTLFCGYRFKYLVTHAGQKVAKDDPPMGLLYQDNKVAIYDLELSFLCEKDINDK
jgi:hypothetical protein